MAECDPNSLVLGRGKGGSVHIAHYMTCGIPVKTICAKHENAATFTTYTGFIVDPEYKMEVMSAIMEINSGMICGYFGIDSDREIYFKTYMACEKKGINPEVAKRQFALGPKMIKANMGQIIASIPEKDDDGKEEYRIKD